jgi:hypothetical protein
LGIVFPYGVKKVVAGHRDKGLGELAAVAAVK